MAIKYPYESDEQSAFVKDFRKKYKDYKIISIPNGSFLAGDKIQRARQMAKLKREGLEVGCYDTFVMFPNARILFIEFKRQKDFKVSKDQEAFRDTLDLMGFDHFIAYGCVDGVAKFKEYLIFNEL